MTDEDLQRRIAELREECERQQRICDKAAAEYVQLSKRCEELRQAIAAADQAKRNAERKAAQLRDATKAADEELVRLQKEPEPDLEALRQQLVREIAARRDELNRRELAKTFQQAPGSGNDWRP